MPLMGSLSALPSWMADLFMSVPSATDMSSSVPVACLKMSLPLPVSLRMFVKVSSMFSPAAITSSSTPDTSDSDSA